MSGERVKVRVRVSPPRVGGDEREVRHVRRVQAGVGLHLVRVRARARARVRVRVRVRATCHRQA